MTDRDFLMWIHERMEYIHKESPLVDYMRRLRDIIKATPPDQVTPNVATENSLNDLKDNLK